MPEQKKKVWFNKTFSSVHSALLLIRRGGVGEEYRLVCSSSNPHAIGFLAAHESATEPSGLTGPEYIDWCLDFCREQQIDIFVPGKEASLISSRVGAFEVIGTRVMCAGEPGSIDLIHNKASFYQATQTSNVPAPEFTVFDSLKSFDKAYDSMRAKHTVLCMKPSVSVYGIGFRKIVENRSAFGLMMDGDAYRIDLRSLREMLEREDQTRPMLLMPYLDGHEFSVDCVASNGALVCAVARRKSRKAGGGQEIVVRDDINTACVDLISQFDLNGNINIQFREGNQGLRILEINPRMSGGITMACLAGPNLPYIALAVFDRGLGKVDVPPTHDGLRVGEVTTAVLLP
ncbi:MAG: ATP-grasp domain-containing protein [Sulfuricellaceae bacterium]|nr:ATP-grasp domain-containing protein [Sulfuricellaceae bacterium]